MLGNKLAQITDLAPYEPKSRTAKPTMTNFGSKFQPEAMYSSSV